MEALLGASLVERGFDATREVVRDMWTSDVEGSAGETKHPKSALQEWAAGNKRSVPHYEVIERNGPDHAARSEEHTSELQSLMRISYAVFCLKNIPKYYIQEYAKQTSRYTEENKAN